MIGRWSAPIIIASLALLYGTTATAEACPFCSMQGQTLMGEVNQAALVVFGTLENPRQDPDNPYGGGSTELHVEAVVKHHDFLDGKKHLVLPRFLPAEKSTKYLFFCGLYKDRLDPYRVVSIKNDIAIVKYLQGALAVKDKPIGERLRFFFEYLDNADIEISNDAYKEFANADYKDVSEIADKLPADKLARWLEDPNTPSFRYGLYASLLGHCGTDKHADLLRKMLDDPRFVTSTGIDGMLAAYAMLKPKEGWNYIRTILGDPSKKFTLRYAALRVCRFFWSFRPDIVSQNDVVAGIGILLDQSDIADFAIDDLRKWKRWDLTDRVIDLNEKKSHDIPVIHRAILRYALSCQHLPKAPAFVAEQRKKDPELVKEVADLLEMENNAKSGTPVGSK